MPKPSYTVLCCAVLCCGLDIAPRSNASRSFAVALLSRSMPSLCPATQYPTMLCRCCAQLRVTSPCRCCAVTPRCPEQPCRCCAKLRYAIASLRIALPLLYRAVQRVTTPLPCYAMPCLAIALPCSAVLCRCCTELRGAAHCSTGALLRHDLLCLRVACLSNTPARLFAARPYPCITMTYDTLPRLNVAQLRYALP
jgi:hypothetical protein